jgi:iron(III) transport system permease protein
MASTRSRCSKAPASSSATVTSADGAAPMPLRVARSRRSPTRPWLFATSAFVAGITLLPLVFLVLQAHDVGAGEVRRVLWRRLSFDLLTNTVELAVCVAAATAVLGVATAWCVERTALPGRRIWAVLLVLPASIPDFVVGYAWHSIRPGLGGLHGAVLVMSLDLYPLVYLPVAAAFRRVDPALEETARSLGKGPWETFFRVTLPQIRPALLGGCLVVTLALLAEFGVFEILHFQTFTTEIFTEFKVDQSAASALALLLVVLGIAVLVGEGRVGRRARVSRSAPAAVRPVDRRPLGHLLIPTLLLLLALVALALAVPLGTLVYWLVQSQHSTLPASATLLSATLASVRYAGAAAGLATVAAIPVALLAQNSTSRIVRLLERSTYLVQSIPGVVIGLSLVFFAIHYATRIYQSSTLLVAAYALLFFPLALVCIRASVAQAPPRLAEMGRSLGHRPMSVLMRVTLPLIAPGIGAAFSLVFLSAVTELTATLLLVPTGTQTLATEFWAYQTNASYGAAAPYAAMIVAIAAIPSVVLGVWFARRTGNDGRVSDT